MINNVFLHQLLNVEELFLAIAKENPSLDESLVEKDYWIMHCLWGIQQQGYRFELKGGTSLSKAFGIIERFSEDIDIQIHPEDENVKTGKNHNKPSHIEGRKNFFDTTASELKIPDLVFSRDHTFDDVNDMRSAGIRAEYSTYFDPVPGLKEGVLLELVFDTTTPNMPCDITSWAFEKALELKLPIIDNRAKQVACYYPEYTFVEKLQTISTKYRKQQNENTMPINFLRHYYDVYKLLENERVLKFIGSKEYIEHKNKRFRTQDEKDLIKKNDICEINYNPSKTAAIVNVDCGSAIYINFKTKQTSTVVKHWPNVWSTWLTENLVHITGPCGTGCSQSIIFVAPATIISCPIHEYRITSLSPDEFPDFYNNNPLLIEPNKGIYVCYSSRNDIQVFKLPKQLQTEIHPPKGYYSEKAIIRGNKLLIFYKNVNGNIKQISYGKI